MGSYFQLKYAIALITAFSIDALQFLTGIVIAAIFFHPATAVAVLGCVVSETYIVSNSCWIAGIISGVVGGVASVLFPPLIAFTDAMGAGFAAVIDFCFTMVGYGIILPMLLFQGIVLPGNFFKSWRRAPFILLKLVPGLNMLPFFTSMVLMSIIETETLKKQRVVVGAAAAAAGVRTLTPLRLAGANRGGQYAFAQTRDIRSAATAGIRARSRTPLVEGVREASAERRTQVTNIVSPRELWDVSKESMARSARTPLQNNTASLERMRAAA